MKYFILPNIPNDVWFGNIDKPNDCELVCSCPSDGKVKAVTIAALLQFDVDENARLSAQHDADHQRHQLKSYKKRQHENKIQSK